MLTARFFTGLAADTRVKITAARSSQEVVDGAAELGMHLARLATTMEKLQSRGLLLTLTGQLPSTQFVPSATRIPRQKRRVKWYAKVEDPPG